MTGPDPPERTKPGFQRKRWWVLGAVLVAVVIAAIVGGGKHTNVANTGSSGTRASGPTTRVGETPSTTPATDEEDNLSGPGAPTVPGGVVPAYAGSTVGPVACRAGDPLANVYHPNRLAVVSACMTVSGTVESVHSEADGDTHFDVALDPSEAGLLKPANYSGQHGWLVAEIVPADELGCTPGQPPRPATGTYNYGICSGADETAPAVGIHVYVTGPYVLDEDHGGWSEIHPVWAVSPKAPTTGTAPAPATQSPTTTVASSPGVRIVSVSSPVSRGSGADLVAQTGANASCNLSVTLPSGAPSQSQGLGPGTADPTGRVEWRWRTGTRTTPGSATATVQCGSASATTRFEITG